MTKKVFYSTGFGLLICSVIVVSFFIIAYTRRDQTHLFSQDSTFQKVTTRTQSAPLIVYGYLPYWTKNKAVFTPTLTHVSYFSLGIQQNGKLLDIPLNSQEAGYRNYQNNVLSNLHQAILPSQKLELTLTMMDQDAIPIFLKDPTSQDTFLEDLQKVIQSQPITGINVDIEYNGLVDSELQQNLANLLHRMKVLLKGQSPPLNLSIATYSDAGDLQRLTHLKKIEPEVDHIIMMAYDFHRSKSPNAGPNSPLFGKSKGRWGEDIMSDLKLYLDVVPSEKILLGVPFYGYAWSVEDGKNPNSFTLPKTGESVPYANIQKLLARSDITRHWDNDAFSPYLQYSVSGKSKVLYYDDPESIRYKMTLVQQANLGGIAIWALGYDEGDRQLWDAIGNFVAF